MNKFLFCCKTEHKGISKPQTPYVLEFLRVRPSALKARVKNHPNKNSTLIVGLVSRLRVDQYYLIYLMYKYYVLHIPLCAVPWFFFTTVSDFSK